MSDRPAERGQRVTPLELFFDLVVVFAITQVTSFLSRSPTWGGLLRGLLLLGALWWAWAAYAWLTNAVDPEEGVVRLAVLAAVAAMLVVSLAAPRAFGDDGVTFGVAYLVVRALHLVLFAIAGRGDREMSRAVLRLATSLPAPVLLVLAGFLHGSAQLACWAAALAILYLGPLVGHMRGFRVSPEHFVERFGLIIIIALGESIVAIGVGAAGLALDAGVLAAALLGITVAASLWWSYFDWVVYVAQARLADATGAARAAFARDAYSYLHLPMVGGIVLFAFGLKATLAGTSHSLAVVPAVGLCGGVALYLLAHVGLRLRTGGGIGRGRPVATVLLLGLIPAATHMPALAALGLVAAVCVALIAYEVLRHREARAWIRSRRGAFTMDEARARLREQAEAVFEPEGSTGADGGKVLDHYGVNYARFASDIYATIRREAFGEDVGQNSWLTMDELERFVSLLDLDASSLVLDVGCGSGGPALHLSRRTGCQIVGVDVREDAIANAIGMAREAGRDSRMTFRIVDASGPLPFDDASFDAILCIDAVNHLPERRRVFADWARLLRPGGRLVFTDPITVTGVLDSDEIAIRSWAGTYLFVPPGEDEQLLTEAGLTVVTVEDATENMAEIARRRHDARANHEEALRQVEGDDTFHQEQRFLEVAARLARERRLSRLVYVARKPGSDQEA